MLNRGKYVFNENDTKVKDKAINDKRKPLNEKKSGKKKKKKKRICTIKCVANTYFVLCVSRARPVPMRRYDRRRKKSKTSRIHTHTARTVFFLSFCCSPRGDYISGWMLLMSIYSALAFECSLRSVWHFTCSLVSWREAFCSARARVGSSSPSISHSIPSISVDVSARRM